MEAVCKGSLRDEPVEIEDTVFGDLVATDTKKLLSRPFRAKQGRQGRTSSLSLSN
jgi:hypothetical protein